MPINSILFPLDPMVAIMGGKPVVDEHFQQEMDYARSIGWSTGLYDHDAVATGNADRALKHAQQITGQTLLRGYMLSVEQYQSLEAAVAAKGACLATDTSTYQSLHHLPGWYQLVPAGLTPISVWGKGTQTPDLTAFPTRQGFVKDYVKSVKHVPEACCINDVSDPQAIKTTLDLFLQERGPDLQGGLVVRAWTELKDVQWRTWWSYGQLVASTCHPDTDGLVPESQPPTDLLVQCMQTLNSPLATADFAQDEKGHWHVVELGDGQVSDRPRSIDTEIIFAALSS